MAVSINVLSTFNDAGLKKAQAEMGKLNKKVGSGMSGAQKSAGALGAGVLAGAGVAIGGLINLGATFDDAYDGLRANTGKTGAELESLKGSLDTVATTTATSFGVAGQVISILNSKLGLTGGPLETVTKNLIDLSRITGTDLTGNVNAVAKAFQNFGVLAAYQGPALDILYTASQKSGISVADLASALGESGAVLRATGLDFTSSVAFIAQLGKAGVDASDVMPSLTRNIAAAGKAGQSAGDYLKGAFDKIKNAPSDTAGAAAAVEAFGKRGAVMGQLIREGKLDYEAFNASLKNGDGIAKATTDTEDFAEKFTKLKNRIMEALKPFAEGAFKTVGEIFDKLGPKVEQVTNYFKDNKDALLILEVAIGAIIVAVTILTIVMAALAIAELGVTWPLVLFIVIVAVVIAALVALYAKSEGFRTIVDTWVEAVKMFYGYLWDTFVRIWGVIQWLWEKWNILKDKITEIASGIKDALISAFKSAFNFIVDGWNATIGGLRFTIPDWIPGIGGKTFQVPQLAKMYHTGGIVQGMPGASVPATLQTGEMVLTQNQQAMLLGAVNGQGGGGNHYSISVNVSPTADKASVGKAVVESIREFERRSGSSWRAA